MDEREYVSFERKVAEEILKREKIISEADAQVQKIEQHYQDKKAELEAVDVERMAAINEILDAVKIKDASRLDTLFERLR